MFNPFESGSETETSFFESEPTTEADNIFAAPTNTTAPQMTYPSSSQQSNKKQLYNIIDMYWIINNKLANNQKLNDDELELAIIGYNADFSNLRVSLLKANNTTFTESSVLKYDAKQVSAINIFSETAQQILFAISQKQVIRINNFERIFSPNMSNDWKPTPAVFDIDGVNKIITLKTSFNNRTNSFTFSGWSMFALGNAFNFMTNGQSWRSSLQSLTSKNS